MNANLRLESATFTEVSRVRRRNRSHLPGSRDAHQVLVSFYRRGNAKGSLVDVRDIVLTVVRHENTSARSRRIHVAGFAGAMVPWGIQWGGPQLNVFEKDLSLAPLPGGPGPHFDSDRPKLLRHAIELNRCLQSPTVRPVRNLRLPKLWGAFQLDLAGELYGDGPELAMLSRQLQVRADALFSGAQRQHEDLLLLPLDWVSHHWQQMVTAFVDLGTFPKRQLLHLSNGTGGLHGYRGAMHFDLISSRFMRQRSAA